MVFAQDAAHATFPVKRASNERSPLDQCSQACGVWESLAQHRRSASALGPPPTFNDSRETGQEGPTLQGPERGHRAVNRGTKDVIPPLVCAYPGALVPLDSACSGPTDIQESEAKQQRIAGFW